MEKRTRSAGTKLTEGEYERLERAAQARGLKLGEWVREVLLEAAEPASRGRAGWEKSGREKSGQPRLSCQLSMVSYC